MAEWSTLARPYAKAAFDVALEHDALGAWAQQLGISAAVVGADKVRQLIDSPAFTAQQQADAVIGLLDNAVSPAVGNFLRLLAENKRLRLLPEIVVLFEQMKANQEKSVNVDVVSAFPLDNDLHDRLVQALRRKLQREVTINAVVDNDLLGGVVIRAGDVVIDGSVRGRLAKLAKAMNS